MTVPIIYAIFAKVKLGTISHGTGQLRYFGLTLIQRDEFTTLVVGDRNLSGIASLLIPRLHRQLEAALSPFEAKLFCVAELYHASLNQ